MEYQQFRGRWAARLVGVVVCAAWLSCGTDVKFADGHLHGVALVAAGPIAGGTVRAYTVDEATGTRSEQPVGEALTADTGTWDLDVGVATGTLVVEVSGGRYDEASSGERVVLDDDVFLRGAVTHFAANEDRAGVVVSPLTTLATSFGEARLAAQKELTAEAAFDSAYEIIGRHFCDVAIGTTVPSDPTKATMAQPTEDVRYGLCLGGFSMLARQIADLSGLSTNSINTASVVRLLARDLASAEALFDGRAADGAISLGTCPLPMGCTTDCDTVCTFDSNTARADLALAILTFLNSSRNATGLRYADTEGMVTAVAEDTDPELFPTDEPPKPIDTAAPMITFVTPEDGDVVSSMMSIEVTATDDTRVASLVVIIGGTALPDTDPAPERFTGAFNTQLVGDGPLTIQADAEDAVGNALTATATVTVNNLGVGLITGRCIKGPLEGADVRAFAWALGAKGAELGADPDGTDADGNYGIGLEGYTGPILIECGGAGATYLEEAFDAAITLGTADRLRTVVEDYVDGTTRTQVMVTPWTSIATAYLEYLISQVGSPTPTDVLNLHYQAYQAISDFLWVADVATVVPAPLDGSLATVTSDTNRYALEQAGLSQLAVSFADINGTVTPGAAVNGASLWKALEDDISDGCFDGKQGLTSLSVVGVPLTSQTVRVELATAVSNYLAGTRNTTGITNAQDATDLFDRLSLAGPLEGAGDPAVCEAGDLFPDPGLPFDREPPEITWDPPTPAEDAVVGGIVTFKAHATDLSPATLTVGSPAGADALDVDLSATGVNVAWDTVAGLDGALPFVVDAIDAIGNAASSTRTVTVDNTPPTIVVTGVAAGGTYSSAVTPVVTIDDPHLAVSAVTLDGVPYASGPVTTNGPHILLATAQDVVGNASSVNVPFTIDTDAPTITWSAFTPADGLVLGGPLTAGATASDPQGIGAFVIVEPAGATDGEPSLESIVYADSPAPGVEYVRTLHIQAQDTLGHVADDSRTWRLDTWAPRITIGGVAADAYYQTQQTPSFYVTDANLASTAATLDGGAFVSGTPVSAEGTHTLAITASDVVPHTSTATRTFTIDYTLPIIAWNAPTPADGTSWRTDFTIDATATDANLADNPNGLRITAPAALAGIDGDSSPGHLLATIPASTLPEAAYAVQLRADDRAGWTRTESRTFFVDRTAPTIAIATTSPAGLIDGDWASTNVTVQVTVSDEHRDPAAEVVSAPTCGVPTITTGATSRTWTFVCATEAQHVVTASAADAAGNSALTQSRTYYIDKTAPTITISSGPAGGSYQRGSIVFTAVIDDNFKNLGPGSLPNGPASLDVSIAGTGPYAPVLVRTPLGDGRVQLQVTLATTTANDGALTVTFQGQDRAGNPAGPAARTITVDNTAPSVAIATSGWVTSTTPSITGTVSDVALAATSPLEVVIDEETMSPVACTEEIMGTTFAAVPTMALAQGAHSIKVTATDAAGNTRVVTGGLSVDTVPPIIGTVNNEIADDSGVTPTFNASWAPSYSGAPTLMTTLGDAVCPSMTCPTVRKVPTRLLDHAAASEPIEWRFNATDNLGSGVVAADISYTITAPDGSVLGPFAVGGPSDSVPAAADRAAYVTEVEVPAPMGGLSKLETLAGIWTVTVNATDVAGNPATPRVYKWSHVPLAEAIHIEKVTGEPPLATSFTNSLWNSMLELNSMAALINGTATKKAIVRYRLHNGSSRAVYVGFFVPNLSTTKTWQKQTVDHSPSVGTATIASACNDGSGAFAWRINTDGSVTCEEAGWTRPTNTHPTSAVTSWTNISDLIGAVAMYNDLAPVTRCTTGGCAMSVPEGVYYEFLVPATPGSFTTRYVTLEVDNLVEFAPSTSVSERTLTIAGGTTINYTGEQLEQWARCTSAVDPDMDGIWTCTGATKYRRYKALNWGRVSVANLRVGVRTRPAVSLLATSPVPLPQLPYDLDNDLTGPNTRNYGTVLYETCEGTWSGGTCPLLP